MECLNTEMFINPLKPKLNQIQFKNLFYTAKKTFSRFKGQLFTAV